MTEKVKNDIGANQVFQPPSKKKSKPEASVTLTLPSPMQSKYK